MAASAYQDSAPPCFQYIVITAPRYCYGTHCLFPLQPFETTLSPLATSEESKTSCCFSSQFYNIYKRAVSWSHLQEANGDKNELSPVSWKGQRLMSRSSTAFLSNKKLNSQPVYRMSDAKKHLAVSREWREESSGPAAVWRKASGRLDPVGSVDLLFQGSTHFGNRICDSLWKKSLVISFYFCKEIASWDCQLWSQGIKKCPEHSALKNAWYLSLISGSHSYETDLSYVKKWSVNNHRLAYIRILMYVILQILCAFVTYIADFIDYCVHTVKFTKSLISRTLCEIIQT